MQILERPNAIIRSNGVVCKLKNRLSSDLISKNDIVSIFQIVGKIIGTIRVDNWIGVVNCKKELLSKHGE
jgi:hypothetical protein